MLRNVPLKKLNDPTRKGVFTPKNVVVHQMKVMDKQSKLDKFSL